MTETENVTRVFPIGRSWHWEILRESWATSSAFAWPATSGRPRESCCQEADRMGLTCEGYLTRDVAEKASLKRAIRIFPQVEAAQYAHS